MKPNNFFSSKAFKIVAGAVAVSIIALLSFAAGTMVGFNKAGFSYQWGENYHKNFAGPAEGFGHEIVGGDFMEAHGLFGQIIKIDGSTLVINGGRNNSEKAVLVDERTIVNKFRDRIALVDLKVDDEVVVIGDPNGFGQIEAKLIRVMPPQRLGNPGREIFPLSPPAPRGR